MSTKAGEENTEVCSRGIGLAEMCRGVHSMDLLLVASVYGSTVTHFKKGQIGRDMKAGSC
jgi:hypothetical protein